MTIGNNTAYEIISYIIGNPSDQMQILVVYILAGILSIIFFIGILYLMKIILMGILHIGDT